MQATNSALRIREGILRGCSFLRRFQVSSWNTLHLARNLLRQSTLQAHQKLRERNRSINKWIQLDFLSINIFMNLFEITSLTYLIRIFAREIYKKLCSVRLHNKNELLQTRRFGSMNVENWTAPPSTSVSYDDQETIAMIHGVRIHLIAHSLLVCLRWKFCALTHLWK